MIFIIIIIIIIIINLFQSPSHGYKVGIALNINGNHTNWFLFPIMIQNYKLSIYHHSSSIDRSLILSHSVCLSVSLSLYFCKHHFKQKLSFYQDSYRQDLSSLRNLKELNRMMIIIIIIIVIGLFTVSNHLIYS